MRIKIYRGTHQIGGSAIEFSTDKTRIIIDMGQELGLDSDFRPADLDIEGVTRPGKACDAVLISHYHGDHIGQLSHVLQNIPIYMGRLCKEIALIGHESKDEALYLKILGANSFEGGKAFFIGDIKIRPLVVDHGAADSYMFIIEAEGKSVLYTGDFRLHGLRSRAFNKMLHAYVGDIDVLITEGTSISRQHTDFISEREVLEDIETYMSDGKYVFVMCASTNIDRIMGIWQRLPSDKILLCDRYQKRILDAVLRNVYYESSLYTRHDGAIVTDAGPYPKSYLENGFVSLVKATTGDIRKIRKFSKDDVRIVYSMWPGYIRYNEELKDLLDTYASYICHSSGHVSPRDLLLFVGMIHPKIIIPVHTENPEGLQVLLSEYNVAVLNDGEVFVV